MYHESVGDRQVLTCNFEILGTMHSCKLHSSLLRLFLISTYKVQKACGTTDRFAALSTLAYRIVTTMPVGLVLCDMTL